MTNARARRCIFSRLPSDDAVANMGRGLTMGDGYSRSNGDSRDAPSDSGVSRRSLLVAAAAAGTAIELGARSAALAQGEPAAGADLVLYNGKIRTMDERNPVVSAARVRGNRFVEVGKYNSRKSVL